MVGWGQGHGQLDLVGGDDLDDRYLAIFACNDRGAWCDEGSVSADVVPDDDGAIDDRATSDPDDQRIGGQREIELGEHVEFAVVHATNRDGIGRFRGLDDLDASLASYVHGYDVAVDGVDQYRSIRNRIVADELGTLRFAGRDG